MTWGSYEPEQSHADWSVGEGSRGALHEIRWRGGQLLHGGQPQEGDGEETTFLDIAMWGTQEGATARFKRKGGLIFLEGRLQQDRWKALDGCPRSKIAVVAEKIQVLPNGGGARSQATGIDEAEDPFKHAALRDRNPRVFGRRTLLLIMAEAEERLGHLIDDGLDFHHPSRGHCVISRE